MNLKLCSKQNNKIDLLHLIVALQLSGGWRHNYSTKTRQTGHANEQSMYSLISMGAQDGLVYIVFKFPAWVLMAAEKVIPRYLWVKHGHILTHL